jgi:phenylpropionate dioxygenase-like ring-hydroxylating dioxygenase large terminal subunit
MAMLDHWHPVLPSRALPPERVAGVRVAGEALAIFRDRDGKLGAVADQCAHRRMKLSLGKVRCGRIVCPYHGWSFDTEGRGESPSSTKTHARVMSYDCAEASGAIWIKARGSERMLTAPTMAGWHFVGLDFTRIGAPLELVIDNFSEVEHTVTAHPHFGFEVALAGQAVNELASTEDAVIVRSHGPAKMPPFDTRLLVGIRRGDHFRSDFTFQFDPPRSVVTHAWTDPAGRERMLKYHVHHYFVPEDERATMLVTFGFLKTQWPVLRHFTGLGGWLLLRGLRQTVEEDRFLLENLADQSPDLAGMTLSRFDPVLAMTRERLQRIYYGQPTARAAAFVRDAGAAPGANASGGASSFPASAPSRHTPRTPR